MALLSNFIVNRYETRLEMGRAAARDAARAVNALLKEKDTVRMIFAAAPSQNEFLDALVAEDIDFSRIEAFHMDEYVGLSADAPQGFGNFLRRRLFDRAPFGAVHFINGGASDIEAECARYSALIADGVDVVCLGIGENGHIAFNDPHEADFDDPALVKRVSLDEKCRMQQVHDGCFAAIDDVPTHALTLTVPALMNAEYHFCIVPAATKAEAVYRTVCGDIGAHCPATALRLCPNAALYVDMDSGAQLRGFKHGGSAR